MHHLFSFLFVKIHTFVHCTWIQFNVIVKKQKEDDFIIGLEKRNSRWHLLLILMIMVSSVFGIHGQLFFDYIVYWDSRIFLQIKMFMSQILTYECATRKKKKEMAQRGQLLLILNKLHIYIYRVLLGHLQTKSTREKRLLKWVTRVIEDDDDDNCSHRCWSTSTTLTTILSWLIKKKELHG